MKSKLISLLVCCVLLLTNVLPTNVVAAEAPKYELENKIVRVGEEFTVDVLISNNPGIISLRFKVVYDESLLELQGVENSGLLNGFTTPSPTIKSPYTLRWADSLATTNNTAQGRVVTLKFKSLKETSGTAIVIEHEEARTSVGQKVVFSNTSSTLVTTMLGDLNGDGYLRTDDARIALRKIIDLLPDFTEEEFAIADMNFDGKINSADVRRMLLTIVKHTGTDTLWSLDDGVLTINDDDVMDECTTYQEDGYYKSSAPWSSQAADITSVILSDSVSKIGSGAFLKCTDLKSISIPNSVTSIGSYSFYRCEAIQTISIPTSVTTIGRYAFYDCGSLKNITIPTGVTKIEDCTFYDCGALQTVKLSNTLTSIGALAFEGCGSLENIILPTSIKRIGSHAFDGCTTFTSIIIPDGVTEISMNAFYGCSNLQSITIPSSITSIETGLLRKCSALATIYYTGTTDQWNALTKGADWDNSTGDYTIQCSDGTLSKSTE